MDPETLETMIMLRFHKNLWDAETLQQCIVKISSTVTPTEIATEDINTTTKSSSTTISGSKRPAKVISGNNSNEESSNNSNEHDDRLWMIVMIYVLTNS